MELLKWEDIKENEKYVDRVYGRITVCAKAIIKDEKLLVITYKDSDRFPVNFDGMKIFKEIYRVKTLEELGFTEVNNDVWVNFIEYGDCFYIFIKRDSKAWAYSTTIDTCIDKNINKAIELKMIELGLWEGV